MEEKDEDLTEEIFDLLEQLGMIPRGYTAEPPRQEEYEDEGDDNYSIDENGVEWFEDEDGYWWYAYGEEGWNECSSFCC